MKTAPLCDSSTSFRAVDWPVAEMGVAGGPQPEMVPFLVAKMKSAGLPAAKAKSALPLNTIPVGLEGLDAPAALGTVTTNGTVLPAPEYRVDVPVPALLAHQGVEAPRASPHAFLRCGSIVTMVPLALAGCGISDTKFVCM